MGLDLLQQLPGPALCLTLHNGVEADALAVGALLDDLLQPVEGAAADEQNVVGVHLDELLMGVLPAALRRHVGHGALQDFQQRLLHALAGHVPGDGGVLALAGDLVDLVHIDDAVLRQLHVEIRRLQQPQQDVLHVVSHITGFGEGGSVGDGEGDLQHPGQGLGHGNLGAMLLSDESKCFAFLAGHESFAAAEGAIGIVKNANKARKQPLRVILNGLGKDAAQIISRINGFTYVQTQFDYYTGKLNIVREIRYSEGERADVRCYGADDVREGVAIMHHEGVDVSITGNSTNPTRFQHPVAGTYKKECIEQGKKYFSVASGGGTGRTLHPDNMAAGPASYGMTDTMGRMHSDAQFAGSSSVPAHVEMMGFLGMGNNPMVGATVAVAVAVEQSLKN